ncbi:type I methionyl aminopeptidase [Gulosibacter chungangensis]|uniref:Methionine aminopeptidase n=1 Tax=Gulosibacter chungangensis TaxID=979746 RepID=A0A7J5B7J5_9MICO|nr:type I methionyl aminopeptidase [Gulosibacter chungangensis]KAB1640971.1 type I methionyl aminopeptidase [Gulosibacter chungangensis]
MASIYKTPDELRLMVPAGILTAQALDAVGEAIRPGISTLELDAIAERVIRDGGGVPNFQLVDGYHHTVCASVNDAIVHGIPNETPLKPGDVVSIDCGAMLDGWNGDSARTWIVPGEVEGEDAAGWLSEANRVSDATQAAMWAGIAAVASARHLNDVGTAIEEATNEQPGTLGILENYTGHGIGRNMHEEPTVFNYRVRRRGPVVKAGLAICIEPMLTGGSADTLVDDDDWTVRSADGSVAAHWEHTVIRHKTGIWVTTAHDGGAAGLAAHGVTPVAP